MIARIPRSVADRDKFLREKWVLLKLRDRTRTAVPRYEGPASSERVSQYPRIPGDPLSKTIYRRLHKDQQLALGVALGRFLHDLHVAIDPCEARDAGLVDSPKIRSAETLRREFLPLVEDRNQAEFVVRLLDRYADTERAVRPDDLAVLHNDLHGYNLLVDAHGALSGVIDFADVSIADRHNDFRFLLMWGPRLLAGALHGYALAGGPGLSFGRSLIYSAANDLDDMLWRTRKTVALEGGPIVLRLRRLQRTLGLIVLRE